MSRYKAYPSYKETRHSWLESVPAHWEMLPLKFLTAQHVTDGPHETPEFIDEGVPFLSVDGIQNNQLVFEGCRYISREDHARYSIKCKPNQGDVLLGKAASVGKVAHVDTDIEFNVWSPLAVIRPRSKKTGRFIYYSLQSALLQMQCDMYSNANTQKNLGMSTIDNLAFASPTDDEAEQIAYFLDHETAKIDALIEKQQRLIELLKEKRQAVISYAVTKGLNPNAPMKDSAVEWLGEVPAHWSLPKVKWFFRTESGGTPNTAKHDDYYLDGTIPWIRTTDLNNDELYETPINITKKAVVDSACSLLPVNSVLVAMYGGAGSIGKHALLKFESTINQAVCAILPNPKIGPEFLHLYVEFYRPYWMVGAEGTRKDPNINQDVIRELIVPCPPYDEQLKIAETIKVGLSKIDSTIKRCETNIELIQERRTALISAAVTGKIDVRDWQAAA